MKLIYVGTAVLIVIAIIFGGIAPWLISTKSDIAVVVGFIVILATIFALIHIFSRVLFKKEKTNV